MAYFAGLVIEAEGASVDRPDCPVVRRDGVPWIGSTAQWEDLTGAGWAFAPK